MITPGRAISLAPLEASFRSAPARIALHQTTASSISESSASQTPVTGTSRAGDAIMR
jgi:hypothetical protein